MKKKLLICLVICVLSLAVLLTVVFTAGRKTTVQYEPFIVSGKYEYERTEHENVYCLLASEDRGYFFNAYFYIPETLDESDRIVVEPINCGRDKSQDVYNEVALKSCLEGHSFGNDIARELGLPFMTLAFPRPSDVYTHALSSDCMTATGNLWRVDVQFLRAIDDILEIIKEDFWVEIDRKIILMGYSAGGMFTSHFTLLHPERVHIAVAGGNQAAFSIPVSSAKGKELFFPLGISDYENLTGHVFNLQDWQDVHFLLVNGNLDKNDSVNPRDCHPGNEPRKIKAVLGKTMLERTQSSKQFYEENGAKAQFLLYSESGHNWFYDDVLNFVKANCGTEFREITTNRKLVTLP